MVSEGGAKCGLCGEMASITPIGHTWRVGHWLCHGLMRIRLPLDEASRRVFGEEIEPGTNGLRPLRPARTRNRKRDYVL